MSLLNLVPGSDQATSESRRSRVFRPSLAEGLDCLEQRTVLSAAVAPLAAAAPVPLSITHADVTNVFVTGPGTAVATVTLSGKLDGHHVSIPGLLLPITATQAAAPAATQAGATPAATVPILNLSLQIPDLNLLGLHVRLDNCNNGPVTVSVSAVTGSPQNGGGLLGNLLGGLLGGTNSGAVTRGLTGILDGILGNLLHNGTTAGTPTSTATPTPGTPDTIPAGDTELVDLHLAPIHLNLLGLHVDTSQICLNLFADPTGGLLGGLLSGLDNALNPGGGPIVL